MADSAVEFFAQDRRNDFRFGVEVSYGRGGDALYVGSDIVGNTSGEGAGAC